MTGFAISTAVIEQLHRAWPQRFRGIKDSSGDLDYCRDLTARMPDLQVFPSSEVALAEAEASGFAGCISATVNETAPLCAELWAARATPDAALVRRISGLRSGTAADPFGQMPGVEPDRKGLLEKGSSAISGTVHRAAGHIDEDHWRRMT